MSTIKKYFKDIGFIGLSRVILGLQGFILIPLLTKFLSVEEYGIWSQVKITYLLLVGISLVGLDMGIIHFLSGENNKKKINKKLITSFTITFIFATILGLITYFFASDIATLLTKDTGASLFFKLIIALLIVTVSQIILMSFFRAQEKVKEFSAIEVFQTIMEIIFVYVLLRLNFNIMGIIIAILSSRLLAIFVYLYQSKNTLKLVLPEAKTAKTMLSFSLPFTIAPLLYWILQTGDQYILGIFNGATEVGIYAVIYTLSRSVRLIADPMLIALLPAMTRAWNQGDLQEVKKLFSFSYRLIFIFSIPSLVGIIVLAEPIITIISNKEYANQPILLAIISTGVLIYIFFCLAIHLLNIQKKIGLLSKILIFLAAINIILNLILVPYFAALGAAIATLITFCLAGLYGITVIVKMGFDLMAKRLLIYSISATIMGVIILLIKSLPIESSYLKIMTIIITGPIVYFSLLLLTKEIGKREYYFIKELIK